MAVINVENIVVSTQIAKSLDLLKLAEVIPGSAYKPEEAEVLVLHIETPRTVAMLFSDGKAILSGTKTLSEIDAVLQLLKDKLRAVNVQVSEKSEIDIQQMVASADLKKKLDLKTIADSLKNVEYDPKRFPGLIYKKDDPNIVILVFDSGRIICNGTDSEQISTAIDEMVNELSSLDKS
jgi:transcription initiation factor TFIID TATA-box-binding protein